MLNISIQAPEVHLSKVSMKFKEEWNEFVHATSGGSFFHLFDWLEITAEKTGYQLLPLMVKEKNEITGIAPFFLKKSAGITLCVSPPSKMSTPWSGPLFKYRKDRPNKVQKITAEIIEEIHKYLVDEEGADYINITTIPKFKDVRPFKWLSYNTTPLYTYMVDIEESERTFSDFENKIKREVKATEKSENISYEGHDDRYFYHILDVVKNRYKEQWMNFPISDDVIKKMLETDLSKYLTTRSVITDKGIVTGLILIVYKNSMHHWIGATKPLQNYPGACSYLHWKVMKEFSEKGMKFYELMGGNTKHLIDQKSRFNGELVPYYNSEWSNVKGRLVKGGMKLKTLYKDKIRK